MFRSCAVVAAGTGEGKTLVSLALTRAFRDAGHDVAPFKCGPDFIDAMLYDLSCGRRARNVDLWLDGSQRVRSELERAHAYGATIVVEGMMGLFDGDDAGLTSSAHILAQNDIPALLVIDGWRMSQTAAAIALGCASTAPHVRILGVILNRCAGEAHARAVRTACAAVGIPLLATLPNDAKWSLPERHLGLDIRNRGELDGAIAEAARHIAAQVDLATIFGDPASVHTPLESPERTDGPIIAYAEDDALWFTYPQTLDALRAAGARCVSFSPLRDERLPDGASGLWLGGGYPEQHARELAENAALREEIATRLRDGMPAYAECGGMMYLAEALETGHGTFPMVGALRGSTSITSPRLQIGYRRARAARDSVLEKRGAPFNAYEFHYASGTLDESPAYEGDGDPGAWRDRVVASFLHRRFFPGDATIERFVAACAT